MSTQFNETTVKNIDGRGGNQVLEKNCLIMSLKFSKKVGQQLKQQFMEKTGSLIVGLQENKRGIKKNEVT